MEGGEIIHDEHTLKAQHGERWAKQDAQIDAKLAEIREKNGGKPPNIVYILLDDLGFGEIGMPDLDVIRGYSYAPDLGLRTRGSRSCGCIPNPVARRPVWR